MKGRYFYLTGAFFATLLFCSMTKAPAQDPKVDPAKTTQEEKKGEEKKVGEEKKTNPFATPKMSNAKRHEGFLNDIKKMGGDVDVVLQGDSITDGWRNTGKTTYQKYWEPLKTLDLGIGGDTTQGVLWRMQNGELEGYKAKVMMLMIGTNNLGGGKGLSKEVLAEQIAEGIEANVKTFREKQPQAKILLLGVFPRVGGKGGSKKWTEAPQHDTITKINQIISKLDDGKTIKYMDIGEKFLDKEGNLPAEVMADGLHPTAKGYEIWIDAVMPTIHEMIGKKE